MARFEYLKLGLTCFFRRLNAGRFVPVPESSSEGLRPTNFDQGDLAFGLSLIHI